MIERRGHGRAERQRQLDTGEPLWQPLMSRLYADGVRRGDGSAALAERRSGELTAPQEPAQPVQPRARKAATRGRERRAHRSSRLVAVHAFAVAAEHVARLDAAESTARRERPEQRMEREPLAARKHRRRGSEHIGAYQHARLGPPKRDLPPEPALADHPELERSAVDRPARNDVVRDAEALRKRTAIASVAVEELDHARRTAGAAQSFLHSFGVNRVDYPDAAVDDERVRAALQEPVRDPSEAELELVAGPDSHPPALPFPP